MPGHAPLAPSSIKYILLCPGRKFAPEQPQTIYTIQGNAAHLIARDKIEKGKNIPEGFEQVKTYTDYVKEIDSLTTRILRTEITLKHPNIKDFWGTVDALCHYPPDSIKVTDLKWGMYDVPAENNPQLMSYLILARHSIPDAIDYFGAIIQPRTKKPIKEASFSAKQLDKFEQQVALVSFQEHRIPGDEQCRFCTLKPNCPEYKQAKRSGDVKV